MINELISQFFTNYKVQLFYICLIIKTCFNATVVVMHVITKVYFDSRYQSGHHSISARYPVQPGLSHPTHQVQVDHTRPAYLYKIYYTSEDSKRKKINYENCR